MRINFSRKACVEKKEKILFFYLPIILIALITVLNAGIFVYYRTANSASHRKINELKQKIKEVNKETYLKLAYLKGIKFKDFKRKYNFFYAVVKKREISWVDLFAEFENLLPPNVKLAMISPKVEGGTVLLSLSAEAKSKADELEFINKLEESDSFSSPFVEYESVDAGTGHIKFSITVKYRKKK